jgi:hypothetical protein
VDPADDRADGALWYDDAAGPMVRPYTMTGGRTRPETSPGLELDLDLITVVLAGAAAQASPESAAGENGSGGEPGSGPRRGPDPDALDEDHLGLLDLCRAGPLSVAELALEADLPVGVVRVLLADLLREGHVRAVRPVPPAELPETGLLRSVIERLRSL